MLLDLVLFKGRHISRKKVHKQGFFQPKKNNFITIFRKFFKNFAYVLNGSPLILSFLGWKNPCCCSFFQEIWRPLKRTRSSNIAVCPSLRLSVLLRPRTCKHSQSIYMKAFILRVCEREKRKRQREGEVTSMVCNCRYDGVCIFATHPVLR